MVSGKHFLDMECMRSVTNNSNDIQDCGCVSLGESKYGFVISDHSDHGAPKEPTSGFVGSFRPIYTVQLMLMTVACDF